MDHDSPSPFEPSGIKADDTIPVTRRGPLVAFIFSLVVIQGLAINLMPVLFGPMERAFGVGMDLQGLLKSTFSAGGIIALFVSGYVTEFIRAKRSGLVAVFFVGAGSLLFGFATNYLLVLMAAFLMGLGTMWVLSAYSAVITAHFAEIRQRMFMWATAAFAASATVSTVLFGYLLEKMPNWQVIFLILAGLIWGWFLLFILVAGKGLHPIAQRQPAGAPLAGGNSPIRSLPEFLAAGLFNRGTFWLLSGLVVLDTVAVSGIVDWTGQLFRTEHGAGETQVGLMISCSSAGVFVGRLLMGAFVSGRFSDRMVLGTCYAAGILSYVIILLFPHYELALVLIFLNGGFIAAQAPTMYSLASAKFGERAATAIPLVDAVGMLGGFMAPTLIGKLAKQFGLHSVLWFIPLVGAVFVVIVFIWEIKDRRISK